MPSSLQSSGTVKTYTFLPMFSGVVIAGFAVAPGLPDPGRFARRCRDRSSYNFKLCFGHWRGTDGTGGNAEFLEKAIPSVVFDDILLVVIDVTDSVSEDVIPPVTRPHGKVHTVQIPWWYTRQAYAYDEFMTACDADNAIAMHDQECPAWQPRSLLWMTCPHLFSTGSPKHSTVLCAAWWKMSWSCPHYHLPSRLGKNGRDVLERCGGVLLCFGLPVFSAFLRRLAGILDAEVLHDCHGRLHVWHWT